MSTQKDKAIRTTKWSAIERLAVQAIQLVISIIIARLLCPEDFGIIGMISIFLGVSQSFIDCGFSQALIYKNNRTNTDSSTIFYFNIVIGFLCYGIIYAIAPFIADFYHMPILKSVTRIISLSIPITSFSLVQRALLTANCDFKSQSFGSVPAALLSGIIGIIMAYNNYGVWALVVQQLSYLIIDTLILWIIAKWRPSWCFSWVSFKAFAKYGSKLLASGLIDTLYNNSYLIVIGKCFNATELGLYSKAKTFPYFASVEPANILRRAVFPLLCQVKDDTAKLINIYSEYLKISVAIITPLIMGLCALSKPVIVLLLSDKWLAAVPVVQLLCVSYALSPIIMLNNNIYQVTGRTDLFLKLEIIKKIIGVTTLCVSVNFGLYGVLLGSLMSTTISLFLNMKFASKIIPLTVKSQLSDIIPIFIISGFMACSVYFMTLIYMPNILQIISGIIVGIFVYIILLKIFKKNIYDNVKPIISKILK